MFYLLMKNKIKMEPPDLSRSDWNPLRSEQIPSGFRADPSGFRVDPLRSTRIRWDTGKYWSKRWGKVCHSLRQKEGG